MAVEKQRLTIWLIKEGEDLPVSPKARLMRVGMLADYLSAQGHEVIWWSSSFNHGNKKYYCNHTTEHQMNANETIVMLHSNVSYKKNISLSRIRYHQLLAKEFKKQAEKKKCPDIILCAWPTSQFAGEAVRYGQEHNVPVILDVRDFWPDIFVRAFPKKMQKLASLALIPMKASAARTFKKATGITGMGEPAVEWGCRYAGRRPGKNDTSIFIGNEKISLTDDVYQANVSWWRGLNVTPDTWNICLFSSLSKQALDLETVIQAVIKLSDKYPDIRLVIGGKGDAAEYLQTISEESQNIVFAGWLNRDQMNSLMKMSKCGVYCRKNTEDFKDAFANKAVQYLAGGLPILNSLTGFARTFIEEHQIGLTYIENDVENCAELISQLYEDEVARAQMASNALDVFESTFEASIVNKQFENYIFKIIQRK